MLWSRYLNTYNDYTVSWLVLWYLKKFKCGECGQYGLTCTVLFLSFRVSDNSTISALECPTTPLFLHSRAKFKWFSITSVTTSKVKKANEQIAKRTKKNSPITLYYHFISDMTLLQLKFFKRRFLVSFMLKFARASYFLCWGKLLLGISLN